MSTETLTTVTKLSLDRNRNRTWDLLVSRDDVTPEPRGRATVLWGQKIWLLDFFSVMSHFLNCSQHFLFINPIPPPALVYTYSQFLFINLIFSSNCSSFKKIDWLNTTLCNVVCQMLTGRWRPLFLRFWAWL